MTISLSFIYSLHRYTPLAVWAMPWWTVVVHCVRGHSCCVPSGNWKATNVSLMKWRKNNAFLSFGNYISDDESQTLESHFASFKMKNWWTKRHEPNWSGWINDLNLWIYEFQRRFFRKFYFVFSVFYCVRDRMDSLSWPLRQTFSRISEPNSIVNETTLSTCSFPRNSISACARVLESTCIELYVIFDGRK